MKILLERYAAAWLVGLLALALAIAYSLGFDDKEHILVTIGIVLPIIYAVHSQRREEVRLFKELFTGFNERYDRLNGKLGEVARLPREASDLTSEQRETLVDYFNLCGEEYLFYRLGYIRQEAWRAWLAGMQHYYRAHPLIEKTWNSELGQGSYYGFPQGILTTSQSHNPPL